MSERPDLHLPIGRRFPGWVYDLGLSAPELALYGVYAGFVAQANGDTINPPMRDICERLSDTSPLAVAGLRGFLEAKGAILVERRHAPDGKSLPPLVTLPRTPRPVHNPVENVERNDKNVSSLARVAEKAATPNQDQVPNQIKGLNQDQGLSTKDKDKRSDPPTRLPGDSRHLPNDHEGQDRDNPNTQTGQLHYSSLIIQNGTVHADPSAVKDPPRNEVRAETNEEEEDFSQKLSNETIVRKALERIANTRFNAARAAGRIDNEHSRESWTRRTVANLQRDLSDEAHEALASLRAATEVDRLVSALTPDLLANAVTDLFASSGGNGPPPIPYYHGPAVSDEEYGPYCTPAENVAWVRKIRANPRKYNTNPPTPDPAPLDAG